MRTLAIMFLATIFTFAGCGKKDEKKGDNPAGKADKGDKGDKGGKSGEIDEAVAKELANTEIDGFKKGMGSPSGTMASLSYEAAAPNEKGATATALVSIGKCMMCQPMDLEKWKANENLKMNLSKAEKENPDLIWEVEEIDLGGKKGIAVYSVSYVENEVEGGGKSTATSNGIDVYYNNGVNMITMMIGSKGARATSAEELKANFTKEEMVATAQKLFAAFAKQF